MDGIETRNASRGSEVPLGFISDRPSAFVLSEKHGDYYSVGDVSNWMQKSLDTIGHYKLRDICVPSSHDAGMSKAPWSTTFAAAGSIITQILSVEQQLHKGVRYLDIRPIFFRGKWVCGHYSFIPENKWINIGPMGTWQGGNGGNIQDIIDGINRFTASSGELIVLQISHTYMVNDVFGQFAHDDFKELDYNHWDNLLSMFTNTNTGIKSLWRPSPNEPSVTDLTALPLKTYIGDGKSAVVLVVDDKIGVRSYPGVFNDRQWQWDYSAWWKEESGRLDEYKEYLRSSSTKPYSFSGCHMQSDGEAVLTTLGQSSQSVLSLATPSKHRLFVDLFPLCAKEGKFPAALTMDAIDSSDLAALCIAFNNCRRAQSS
ncbi:Putative protein of unknown function [Podospora comata]|uniref:PLC-like phosphodiesterase n=1 Tax=Podospora comata TaxID=48703 RepID=A0ABY6SBP7_PODCO|nr:Putative protein of unknown function [Podospora comata]